MRIALALGMAAWLSLAPGCGTREDAAPLFVGRLQAGTFAKYPLGSTANEYWEYAEGSAVEFYEGFVVVKTPDGLSHVHPHDYCAGLVIRRD